MRLEFLMGQMALDWTLSTSQRVDFGVPPGCGSNTLKRDRFGNFV